MKRILKPRYLIIIALLLGFIGVVQYIYLLYSDDLTAFIQSQGDRGMIIYAIYTTVSVMILSLPLIPLWPMVFNAYGLVNSILLTLLGVSVGAVINFHLARRFGRPFIVKFIGEGDVEKVEEVIHIDRFSTFLLLRLIANNYFDAVSYLSGLSNITFVKYFLGTVLASIVWISVSFLTISGILGTADNSYSLVILAVLYYVIAILGLGYLNKLRKRKKPAHEEEPE